MSVDDEKQGSPRDPVDVYTVLLLLSFVALTIGCLILAIDLFGRRMPLKAPPNVSADTKGQAEESYRRGVFPVSLARDHQAGRAAGCLAEFG